MRTRYIEVAKRCGTATAQVVAIASCAALLAGCNTTRETTGAVPMDYRQRHPIVIHEGPRTFDLFIGDRRGTLTDTQRADVLAFAGEWRSEGTGGIIIDVPEGTNNAGAAAAAAKEARGLLSGSGVPAQAITLRHVRPTNSGRIATLRLHYPRYKADAGPCGLWPQDLGPTYQGIYNENRQYWNFGCASQRNLAAMVDNPADLVQPRGEVPPYTGRRTTALDKFHRGEGTATSYPNPDKGKISEVGQ
jgi:pilus assembly protein CpaD